MDKNINKQSEELKAILECNQDLKERVSSEDWSISYNKKADMISMGTSFPEGTFYFPIEETGALLRIDKNNKIYGFAIENAKQFAKENPELQFPLYFIMYPKRSLFIKLPLAFIAYHTVKGIDNMTSNILAVSDYIAGKASFAR